MFTSFKGIKFNACGISGHVCPEDVEVNVGTYGITAMWGAAVLPGLFIRFGGQERHLEWPWSGCVGRASGHEASAGTNPPATA